MKSERFENVISLGSFCSPALEIERFGFRNTSFPFDWCLTDDFSKVLELIDNGFKDLFDFSLFYQWTSQRQVYDNKKYSMTFVHDFSKYEPLSGQLSKVHEKYDRRITKFYDAIERPTLFIRYVKNANEIQYIKNNLNYVRSVLRLDNNDIVFIVNIDDKTSECDQLASDGIHIFFVRKDLNDVVARKFFDQTEELVELIENRFDNLERSTNLKFYREKMDKKRRSLVKKKIIKGINRLVKREYIHQRQVEKYDAREQLKKQAN